MKKKLLAILPRVPYPLEKGDKLRAFNQLRCLADDFEIYLFALNDEKKLDEKSALDSLQFCKEVKIFYRPKRMIAWNLFKAIFNDFPFQVGYFYSCKGMNQLQKWANEFKPDFLFCQLLRVAEYGLKVDVPRLIDYQDVFSKGIERRIDQSQLFKKFFLFSEYRRLLKYENQIFDKFDYKTIISIPDRDYIPHPDREQIAIVPNGVDYDFFYPLDVEKDVDIVFTGNMGYPPNVRAAIDLATKILPLVHKTHPQVKLLISGASPDPKVKALQSDSVTVSGWVDDIRTSYARARIFVAPMQIGTGLQNKLLEAMAMKIPCITSDLANASLGAVPDQDALIGSTDRDFAKAICSLLDQPDLAKTIAENGYTFVKSTYDWHSATKIMTDMFLK